ncbi:FAD/NAD(P)-binding domain-containing protein [Sistotremastrum suecicum HHB10207 ss-3]|uniref:FAD/NAD(P)-binding domain-containing protein n=1 Tax=Sistotremastrum suecicum HHB10207 ss-3 TaxID=1314776 RepID=A0A166B829_9AGAM|nr:FAD/NAD(P)-binding domain-containing protein [Sistotremastrum suecicum HHB10207 ss-3]
MSAPTPLRVIVVGAGLVGSAVGIAFRRAGHHVTIYEKSRFSREVGAAVTCAPNAMKMLLSLGCDPKRMRGVEYVQDQTDDDPTFISQGTDLPKKYGATYYLVHRVDLHNEVRYLATEPEGVGRPCELHLGAAVKTLDPETATITLADGTVASGDIVIGADGINSAVRKFILGEDINPQPSGLATYRAVIPFEKVAANPALSWISTNPEALAMVLEGSRNLVVYPCRDGTLLNVGGNHREEAKDEAEYSKLDRPSSVEEFLETFSDYAPRYKELIKMSPDVSIWPFLIWDELPKWTNSRSALAGDAAHAMFPMLGQGGAQGFEDAVTLGILFPLGTPSDSETISTRLRLFESLRKPRASDIQTMSNRIGRGLPVLRIGEFSIFRKGENDES